MTLQEFYLERQQAERPVFLNVLRALPADHLQYKPHDRSHSAEQVAWTLANELRSCIEAATLIVPNGMWSPPRRCLR